MIHPTGEQYEIRSHGWSAVTTQVGAGLRSLTWDGVELLDTYLAHEEPRRWQGAHLMPWPNRLRDGRYSIAATEYQLPINEVARMNANHGLNVGQQWEVLSHMSSAIRQRTVFWPRRGWPGILAVEILHEVSEDGLTVDVLATNIGTTPVPWGYGTHPYFRFDELSEVELSIPFDAELAVDPERLLPIRLGPVTQEHDFSRPRRIGETVLDTAFTDPLTREWAVSLHGDGRTIEIWGDATTQWVQVFTPPTRASIAIESMTCGPNAFNEGPTHRDRILLRSGESARARWGVSAPARWRGTPAPR